MSDLLDDPAFEDAEAQRAREVRRLTTASLVCGLLSLPGALAATVDFPIAICAVIAGILAVKKMDGSAAKMDGSWRAIVGIVAGVIGLVLAGLMTYRQVTEAIEKLL